MPLRFIHPVQRATHRIGLYVDNLADQKLTQGEAHILALLAETPSATVAELHRGLAHKRSTLTSILDRLEERKLITREVGQADRRTFIVCLTTKGRKVARQVHSYLSKLEKAVAGKLKPAHIAGFEAVISALEKEAQSR